MKTNNVISENERLSKKLCCCQDDLAKTETRDVDYDMSAICADTFSILPILTLTFVGDNGQGTYTINLTGADDDIGQLKLLKSLTGNFKLYVHGSSSDYITTSMYTAGNILIEEVDTNGSGNGVSASFNISTLDHIIFGCTPSG